MGRLFASALAAMIAGGVMTVLVGVDWSSRTDVKAYIAGGIAGIAASVVGSARTHHDDDGGSPLPTFQTVLNAVMHRTARATNR